MASLFHFDVGPLNLIVRAVTVYLAILLLLRIGGKRQIGQFSATEFVSVLLISNAVQNSMNGGDNSLIGGIWLAGILIATSTGVSYLTYRSKFFRHLFEGTPTLLIHHGKVLSGNLRRELITEKQLRVMLRHQGFKSLVEIKDAILEADGTLTVMRSDVANKVISDQLGGPLPAWPDDDHD